MKLCWDILNDIYIARNGDFRKGNMYYLYRDACKNCREPFLTLKQNPGEFCSRSCAQSNHNLGRKRSSETKQKMSVSHKGKKCNFWKGGVTELNIPLFDTYAHQISYAEEVRKSPENDDWLQVKCTKCGKWFMPTMKAVNCRISSLNGGYGECRFYCSDICKENCDVFKCKLYPRNFTVNKYYTGYELTIWRAEILKRADNICEYCGDTAVEAHHIKPKKLEPFFALDPDYGIACCKECHIKYGHVGKCSTGVIASVICKD